MNSQNRTLTDFFPTASFLSDIPYQTSNIETYRFEDQGHTMSKNQKQDCSDIDSSDLDDEVLQSNSNAEFFSTPQSGNDAHSSMMFVSHQESDRRGSANLQSTFDYQHAHLGNPIKRKSNICLSRENIMRHWTPSDDDELMNLADQYKNDWKKIAKRIISNRKKKVTPNFLKNRYKEIAGDHIKKGVKFTHEEDLQIAKLFEIHGTCWTSIAQNFKDRTPVMIKNRYYSHIRRKGLLSELVSEAHGKSNDYEENDDHDHEDHDDHEFLPSPSSFVNSTQAISGENQETSVINPNDSLDMDDAFSGRANLLTSDYSFLRTSKMNFYIDEGLCNLHNNNHEDLLDVRVTDYRYSENNHFQFA